MRDPAHYLTAIKSTTTPKRLLWLDCAPVTTSERGVYVRRWRCGALGATWWTAKKSVRKDWVVTTEDSAQLWASTDLYCKKSRRVVLFAHDLATQLRVSRGLVHLPALGWQLDRIVLERTASWALFRDGKRTLMCCDLKSWAPVPLEQLIGDVCADDDARRVLHAGPDLHEQRCLLNVSVIRDAVLQILDWINGADLGPFRPTGSGQSYVAFRRRFMSHRLLVHDDEERLRAERVAMHTGRCEAWRHGQLRDGPFVEYDMQAAYCRIAAECEIPIAAGFETTHPDPDVLKVWMDDRAVLADVTVTTDVPCVPVQHAGRTVWPVGTFRTWLWDPELQLALDYAQRVECHRAYTYLRAPALKDFAGCVLAWIADDFPHARPVVRRVAKHWSRCLVGRLGLRFRAWEQFGTQPDPDLALVTFYDSDERTETDMLIAGHKRLILAELSESVDSLPQIPGWVMSECRRRLWEAMTAYGLDRVVYVDTDSVVFRDVGSWQHNETLLDDDLPNWHLKGTYRRMTVHGPRNLTVESDRRVSGLPLTARQVAPLEFTGEVMRSIKESMKAGELDSVAELPRRFILDAPDLRRQHLPNGQTAPFELQPTQPLED